jgi:hypothetical protein
MKRGNSANVLRISVTSAALVTAFRAWARSAWVKEAKAATMSATMSALSIMFPSFEKALTERQFGAPYLHLRFQTRRFFDAPSFMDGAGVSAALRLGASAGQLGTAFIA